MIKKITFILILCLMVISCGKKGDPIYKDPKKKVKMKTFLINKV